MHIDLRRHAGDRRSLPLHLHGAGHVVRNRQAGIGCGRAEIYVVVDVRDELWVARSSAGIFI